MLLMTGLCPCDSNKSLDDCCGRFINGAERARTPEQLMRSRYTAHALLGRGERGYGEYLVSTWLLATELGLTAASFAAHTVDWKKLEIIRSAQRGDEGEVEFKAYYSPAKSTGEVLADNLHIHHELSAFKRIKGCWYYVEAKYE